MPLVDVTLKRPYLPNQSIVVDKISFHFLRVICIGLVLHTFELLQRRGNSEKRKAIEKEAAG